MSKCPLCEIDYPHIHFSYDIAEYVDALQSKLEQRIAMEIDEHLKVVSLQEKLDVAVKALRKYATAGNWNEYTYFDGEYAGGQLAEEALKRLEA